MVLRVALSLLMLWATFLHAEIRIKISQGVDSARPIAAVPFKWVGQGVAPEDIGYIVADDLRNSGKFNPLDRSSMPQYPGSAQEVKAAAWYALGINAVVVGQVTHNKDSSYKVAYQLVDTSSINGAVIVAQNSYNVNKKLLRYAGHTASDEVFEKLTGIKGAFRTRIAYVVQKTGGKLQYELRVSDYDGYNQFVVHHSMQPLMSPAWSPDGSKLAYVTFESGSSALVIQTLANGAISKVASFPRHNGAPAFSPDGTKLAFALSKTGSLNVYFMDIESGNIHQVTDSRSNNTEPTWFPDSQHLAFTSDQTGRPQVYKVNINGGVQQRLTWEGLQNQDAEVSRYGNFMVMVSSNNGQQHITKLDLNNCKLQVMSSTILDETPSIAPNETMVIYRSYNGSRSVLNLISTDGRFKTSIPAAVDGQVKFPAWSPNIYI